MTGEPTYLVTGGGGFLGRWLVAKLRARGVRVRVLGRREYPDLAAQGVDCRRGDLADSAALSAACADVECVFHVAARAGIWGHREDFWRDNLTGTENLLAAVRAAGIKRLVYTSTPSVVFDRRPIEDGDERLPYASRFLAAYPASKAAAERLVLAAHGPDLATCALRPHLIWGPGDTNLIPRLIARARAGRLVRIGSGRNLISVSYVENVADAHLAAADRLAEPRSPAGGQAYFINEPEPVNCWEFIGQLLAGLGCPPVGRSMPLAAAYALGWACECAWTILRRTDEPPMTRFLALQLGESHWFRPEKAVRELNWRPAISIAEGQRRLFASVANSSEDRRG